MSEFTGHGHVSDRIQHTPLLQHKRSRQQKHSTSSAKIHRSLIHFYCNDCQKKFRTRILANRNTNAVQHYCALYAKVITRKVDTHSTKCQGDHGMGPCVVRCTDIDPESDGVDETKATYYHDKGKKRPNSKRCGVYTKKRKRDDDYVPTPSKRQRRNHTSSTSPTYSAGYYHPNHNSRNIQQSPPPPPILPHHDTTANTKLCDSAKQPHPVDNDGRQLHSYDKHKPERQTRTEFEVVCVRNHMILHNPDQVLYKVAWKPCLYSSIDDFSPWLKEVKTIQKVKNGKISYKVCWKESWVRKEDLNCAELLAAYALTDLKRKSEAAAARNRLLYLYIYLSLWICDFTIRIQAVMLSNVILCD
eukprot:982841_1